MWVKGKGQMQARSNSLEWAVQLRLPQLLQALRLGSDAQWTVGVLEEARLQGQASRKE